MPTLHAEYITILEAFVRLFSKRIWEHVKILMIDAILSPAERTVTAALRVMGLSGEKHFQNYHRVLNRAARSSLEASRILLGLLISTFASSGPSSWDWTIRLNVAMEWQAAGQPIYEPLFWNVSAVSLCLRYKS